MSSYRFDLEELEGSLRNRVEALVEAGWTEEAAFGEAVQRMGSYGTAEVEYRRSTGASAAVEASCCTNCIGGSR